MSIFADTKNTSAISVLVVVLIFVGVVYAVHLKTQEYFFLKGVEGARDLGNEWIFTNFIPDTGLFLYSVRITTGEISTSNNAIRQLMSARIAAEEAHNNEEILELHRQNLEVLMRDWYTTDEDRAYVFFNNRSKLGANAMLLRVLLASPLYEEYREEAAALVRGILHLQDEQGAFEPWYVVEPDYEYDKDYLLTFYSGEALLALVEYVEKTGDEKVLKAAQLSADFYINRYVILLSEHYYPAYVPWHTLALNKLYKIAPNEKYPEAIFIMNDKLLEMQDTSLVVGRFYNPETPEYGIPHASSDAVYTEGLTYAYEMAKLVGDEAHAATYKRAVEIGVQNLHSLQYRVSLPGGEKLPFTQYKGAINIRIGAHAFRVDTTQHAMDAYAHLLRVFK